jgi:methyl-accepting chemotaxis protein
MAEELQVEDIKKELKKYEGKVPYFVLRDLRESLVGRSITKEQLDAIMSDVEEKVNQQRLDVKIEEMTRQMQKLAESFGSIEKVASEATAVELPLERLNRVEQDMGSLKLRFDETISGSKNKVKELKGKFDGLHEKVKGGRDSVARVNELQKKIELAVEDFYGLSKDMTLILGGMDTEQIVSEILGG